jgi:phosphomevalonate kinase
MTLSTVVSSPGKVLIAGGYLVLDPKYSGIVVSTSSRFYTVVQADQGSANRIRVRSPQFLDAVWEYTVTTPGSSIVVEAAATKYVVDL